MKIKQRTMFSHTLRLVAVHFRIAALFACVSKCGVRVLLSLCLMFLSMTPMVSEGWSATRAQGKWINGIVRDSITGENLGFVNVFSNDTGKGTLTDAGGGFSFKIPAAGATLRCYSVGYCDAYRKVMPDDTVPVVFLLAPAERYLEEIVVRPKKRKYSKRNNPAVAFMERIRKSRDEYDPLRQPLYSYDVYEKTLISLNDFHSDLNSNKNSRKMRFMLDYIDTAAWSGKRVLNLSLKEKVASRVFSSDPVRKKEIVRGVRNAGLDEVLDQGNVREALGDVFREIDVYDNSITLMQNRFVSPLSSLGPDFYKYYLTDTVNIGGERCVELSFAPHNPATMGFNGKIFVPVGDSTMFVKRVSMRVPSDINLNYIKNLVVTQNFVKDSLGNRHKVLDDMVVEMQVLPGTPEFYVRRLAEYDKFTYSPDQERMSFLEEMGNHFVLDEADTRGDDFWNVNRMVPLTRGEAAMGGMGGNFRKIPFLYWTEKIVGALARGYWKTSKESKIDFGPINSFLSYNDVEGLRIKAGGVTTANLSPRWFARGFVAYGTKDGKWKYNLELEHSFNSKKYHSREFPVNGLRLQHKYDLDMLGQHYLFTSPDNIFLSLKRKESDLVTYRHLSELEYKLELANNFSVSATLRHEIQEATRWVSFIRGDGSRDGSFRQASLNIALRWAPGEKFIQGYTNRAPVNMDAPVFLLTHEYGPKGFLGADFTLNRTEFSIMKRFWFSAFGYTDIVLKGGKIWSRVQFPALLWPNANLSFTIQPESFALMNPMEFAIDNYVALDFTYWSQGLLFNHIPWVNKLKLRECVSFRALAGGLTKKNNPEYDAGLYRFPMAAATRLMTRTPYMEIGVGLDNIFTILRLEYVWRLTYRNAPGIDRSGLRLALHFSF